MFLDTFTDAFCHPEQTEERIGDIDLDDSSQPPSALSHSSSSSPGSHVLLLCDGASSSSRSSSSSLSVPSYGSRAVLRHFIVHCVRSPGLKRVVVLSLSFPHSHFAYLSSHSPDDAVAAKQKLTVIDAVSELTFPAACATSDTATPIVQPASHPNPACQQHLTCSSLSDLAALQATMQKLLAAEPLPSALIVDGLSTLLLYHSPSSVLRWLLALRALPELSLLLHADYACHEALSDATSIAALHRIAATRITTTAVRHEKVIQQPPAATSTTDTAIHTTITAHIAHTRSSGRTATKQEHYLLQPTSLTLTAASHTAATPVQPSADGIAAALSSLMVDGAAAAERQRQAKAAVVLPYAHTGDVRVGYGVGGLEVRRVDDEVRMDAEDELLDDEEDDDVDDDLDI